MKTIVALLLCFLTVSITHAQNWPAFRGPNASGVGEGKKIPIVWSIDKSQNILWNTTIPGFSHASPIVCENRDYVITAISSDARTDFDPKNRPLDLAIDNVKHTWRIYCLDKKSGRIIWSN